MNILLITLDQLRGDALGVAGHPIVRTPHLDRLAGEGVRCARHYSQAAPCGPGRASLYTGLYQLNHRVVANGTPLDRRFDNIAWAARRAGYVPTLFGYTDQAIDPREAAGPGDPRLSSYEDVLPGFEAALYWPFGRMDAWIEWLRDKGHDVPFGNAAALTGEPDRPEAHSHSAFVAGALIDWIGRQEGPWFAHLSQLRPHPPYAAAGRFAAMYRPDDMPGPIAPAETRHRLHDGLLRARELAAPAEAGAMRHLMAQYFGMISEVDDQLGRVWAALEAHGQWDDTFILVTADHGEQLGDHGLIQKGGWFEASYHIPCLIRDPRPGARRGAVIEAFTENVDVFPTLAEAMGLDIPAQCDGASLAPLMGGETPPWWRDAAHWEFDWRAGAISAGRPEPEPGDRRRESRNLAVLRRDDAAYVHFGDGTFLAFDLAADPTWRREITDPARVLDLAQAQLGWRARHADRTLTGMLTENGGTGRWPPMPEEWG
ncbi:MAG TPA: sulfatase-like hydrolase/transferase [Caulobacteraceae bacterium]|nr:sulfatase-like hydrolase/transferase [Caulobacteraceae bacterium]